MADTLEYEELQTRLPTNLKDEPPPDCPNCGWPLVMEPGENECQHCHEYDYTVNDQYKIEHYKSTDKASPKTYYDVITEDDTEVLWWINDAGNIQLSDGGYHPPEADDHWSGRFIPNHRGQDIVAIRDTNTSELTTCRHTLAIVILWQFPDAYGDM